MTYLQDSLAEADPRARLEASARQYLRFARDHGALFAPQFTRGGPADPVDEDHRRNATSFRFMVDRVREGMDAGLLPAGDPEIRAVDWWALFHGLAVLHGEGKLKFTDEAFDAHVGSTLQWLIAPP